MSPRAIKVAAIVCAPLVMAFAVLIVREFWADHGGYKPPVYAEDRRPVNALPDNVARLPDGEPIRARDFIQWSNGLIEQLKPVNDPIIGVPVGTWLDSNPCPLSGDRPEAVYRCGKCWASTGDGYHQCGD